MDPTPSLWEGILQRASRLRRRYGNLGDAPQDTWSLVNRVAADKFRGRLVPDADNRDHLFGLWNKAMVSVLNDLHRKDQSREDRQASRRVPLSNEMAERPENVDVESLRALDEALRKLAEQDREMGEKKALVVALKYFEGLTWAELASTLDSSVHRVRDEWAVGRAWLRRELKGRGIDLG